MVSRQPICDSEVTEHSFLGIRMSGLQNLNSQIGRIKNSDTDHMSKIFSNISWLFADKAFRMGAGLIVGAWIARYLGPSNFGLWSVAIAYSALFGSFINFGLESILVKELVKHPDEQDLLLGSSFIICTVGASLAVVLSVVGTRFAFTNISSLKFNLILLSSLGMMTQASFVLNYFYQAKVQAKIVVAVQGVVFVIATAFRVASLLNGGKVITFAWLSLAEMISSSVLMIVVFQKMNGSILNWRFSVIMARRLLSEGFPLMFANIASMIYMRVDQLMIGRMMGDGEVGVFSAAIRISETWYFLPSIIGTSIFPSLISAYNLSTISFERRIRLFFEVMIGVGLGIATIISVASPLIVKILYGKAYAQSAIILSVHVWGGVFVCMGVASSYWLTIHGLQRYNFYRSLSGLAINISLNIFLIPRLGALGAALASAISQMFALFIFDIINAPTRSLFIIKLKAFAFRESFAFATDRLRGLR